MCETGLLHYLNLKKGQERWRTLVIPAEARGLRKVSKEVQSEPVI